MNNSDQAYRDGYNYRAANPAPLTSADLEGRITQEFACSRLSFQDRQPLQVWQEYRLHWKNGYNACTPGVCSGCGKMTAVHEVAGDMLCGECISPPHECGGRGAFVDQSKEKSI